MIQDNFNSVLDALGKPEPIVVTALGLLPRMKDVTEGDSLFDAYFPESGVDLVFDRETSIFIKVHISFKPSLSGDDIFTGPPPFGVSIDWDREQTINALGSPVKSWPPITLPAIGKQGGCDAFPLEGYIDLTLLIGYDLAGSVEQISIIHRDGWLNGT